MLKNKLNIFKNVGIIILIFFTISACERDIKDIGIGLIDNQSFNVGDTAYEIVAYNVNVERSRTDNNSQDKVPLYLLGVNRNSSFGYLKSSVITQTVLPVNGVDFGDNPIIDEVILDLPYFSTHDSLQSVIDPGTGESIRAPSFTLDSIYGNKDVSYQIHVYELETYLSVLDPENPTKRLKYYSDKDYQKGFELHSGDFKPNRNDTVWYVERRYLDDDPSTVDDIDTIKAENAKPSMKFKLNRDFFTNRFVNEANSGYFDSQVDFIKYFKGLYIEPDGPDGSLMLFDSQAAKFTIYYTSEEEKNEAEDEDLNGNGITGEENVIVRVKKQMQFKFGGIRTGKYERDYNGSYAQPYLQNPNTVQGEDVLFAQGAAGSEIHLKLFTPETLQHIRDKGWLLNEANLVFYIDKDKQTGKVPDQMHFYNYDRGVILEDLFKTGSFVVFGGILQKDEEGNPDYYKFRITDFVSNLLKNPELTADFTLALKTFNPTDVPIFRLNDTLIKDYSYIPKGVVLHGNLPKTDNRRVKLEIFYTK